MTSSMAQTTAADSEMADKFAQMVKLLTFVFRSLAVRILARVPTIVTGVSWSPPRRCLDCFKLGHCRFLPHPFQIIIH
jgi:hypothetical protein